MTTTTNLLQYIGAATTLVLTYKAIAFASLYLKPGTLTKRYQRGTDSWALVTGSTNGIGEGFAHALASKNFNILLHGRSRQKLDALKTTLLSTYPGVKVEVVIADAFDNDNDADVGNIAAVARSLPGKLTVLVNNVGGAPLSPSYGSVKEIDALYMDKMINLNARFPAQVTRALLPVLVANTPSLVLNVCSITGYRGMPYLATYSASKAFNYTFSEALGTEMGAEGLDVEVLAIVVGNVVSGGNKTEAGLFTPTSREMAEYSLDRVGCGRAACVGWWRHALQWSVMSVLPEFMVEKILIGETKRRKLEDEKGE